jgi:hypothetical protein
MSMRCWVALGLGLVGCSKDLVYDDTNNYTYSGTLNVQSVDIKPQSDITVEWGGLTTDIRGRPADPAAIQQVSLVGFSGTFDEIRPRVEKNEVGQADAQDIYLFENEGGITTTQLSSFSITGINMDLSLLEVDPDSTWFLSLLNLPEGRTDILSSLHLVPTEGSEVTSVAFEDGSASLDVDVDLAAAPPLQAKAGKSLFFDWSGATKDVFGHAFSDQLGDELIIGHYDMGSLDEVEAEFLRLDSSATELYRVNVFDQTQIALAEAKDADGNPFPGFTEDGIWLVGIVCSTCTTPIPMLLSVVEVR